jgi:DNA-binding XRE family transcriptional regulator
MNNLDLIKIRKKKKQTQVTASVLIGVSYQTYRAWESGGFSPSPKNQDKLDKWIKGV